ncbi:MULTISPECIES: helicase associated domain-containing protein [Mycolicibacterium]|uniref:Helicase associated domain protein n=1 Tax=Mycolicibacterium obuense TaxID=1807 RepID=A0A0J6YNG5_9MYCO|nr:helicase associated domain-containing protein [Mycolicibacterium obuense]KMO74241.1 Helicase associated domain protein [Mycolicibacterium obuense]
MNTTGTLCCAHPPASGEAQPAPWAVVLAALRRYEQHRHSVDVPPRTRAYGVALGRCISALRANYWNGHLDPDIIADVEAVPGWHWGDPPPGAWRTALRSATAAARRHRGGATPPYPRRAGGVDLQAWCARQRADYAAGLLSPAQIDALSALPGWDWDPDEHRWRQGLTMLVEFVDSGGDLAMLHRDLRVNGFALGRWWQRCHEDCRAGVLSAERRAVLAALFADNCCPDPWSVGYLVLQRFCDAQGHARPRQNAVVDGFRLGWWVTVQRRQRRRGALNAERIHLLDALPGWQWNPGRGTRPPPAHPRRPQVISRAG